MAVSFPAAPRSATNSLGLEVQCEDVWASGRNTAPRSAKPTARAGAASRGLCPWQRCSVRKPPQPGVTGHGPASPAAGASRNSLDVRETRASERRHETRQCRGAWRTQRRLLHTGTQWVGATAMRAVEPKTRCSTRPSLGTGPHSLAHGGARRSTELRARRVRGLLAVRSPRVWLPRARMPPVWPARRAPLQEKRLVPQLLGAQNERRRRTSRAVRVARGTVRHWICTFPWEARAVLGYDKQLSARVVSAFVSELSRLLRRRAKKRLGLAHPSPGAGRSALAARRLP
jgi:hypothetical protein